MSGFTTTEHMGLHLLTVVACAVDNENITTSQLNSANLLLGDARYILVAAGEWDEDVKRRIEKVRDRIFSIVDGRREREKTMAEVDKYIEEAKKAVVRIDKEEHPFRFAESMAPRMRAAIDICTTARNKATGDGEHGYVVAFSARLRTLYSVWDQLKAIALTGVDA